MLLEPVDPNQEFRDRRRQARQRRARRRIAVLTVFALSAAVVALGASFLNGRGHPATTDADAGDNAGGTAGPATTAPPKPEPVPLPNEIRGVHVTMALASLDGKLDEYFALTSAGMNTLQLDVKDENGEVGFQRGVGLATRIGAALRYYDPLEAARDAEANGVYLIGRVVVFEDPKLSVAKPGMAIQRSDGSVWTNHAGLGWTNPYDKRVWKYNVDIAVAAAKAGFDEIMFDYVRFPTDGDLASAVFKGRRPEPRGITIANFLRYAKGRLEPLGVRTSAAIFGLTATRDMGIGQRPRRLARYVDSVYPMVYPSHYGPGEYNLDDPNAVPGITVARSLADFRKSLRGLDTELVPWLQDFSLGRDYTLADVQAQILAARDAQARGFLLWNPSGVYTREALAGS
jgi:hypothetical protein